MHRIVFIIIFAFIAEARAELQGSLSLDSLVSRAKRVESFVTQERVSKTPVWRLQQDSPPIQPRTAETRATAQFHKLLKDAVLIKDTEGWELKTITLESPWGDLHWIYIVEFGPHNPQLGFQYTLKIIVLMDGTVVEPKVAANDGPSVQLR
jgi:hypothetical protein